MSVGLQNERDMLTYSYIQFSEAVEKVQAGRDMLYWCWTNEQYNDLCKELTDTISHLVLIEHRLQELINHQAEAKPDDMAITKR